MKRNPGETIQELAAKIWHDALTCEFSTITDTQDKALRTRSICSVENEAILKALFKLKDEELTFARASTLQWRLKKPLKWRKKQFMVQLIRCKHSTKKTNSKTSHTSST